MKALPGKGSMRDCSLERVELAAVTQGGKGEGRVVHSEYKGKRSWIKDIQ